MGDYISGATIGLMKGDTRSLENGSYGHFTPLLTPKRQPSLAGIGGYSYS